MKVITEYPVVLLQSTIYVGLVAVLAALYFQLLAPDVPFKYSVFLYILGSAVALIDLRGILVDMPGLVIGARVLAVLLFALVITWTCLFITQRYTVPSPWELGMEIREELLQFFSGRD